MLHLYTPTSSFHLILYRRAAPKKLIPSTKAVMKRGVLSIAVNEVAADLDVPVPELVPVAVAVTEPEPWVAVPVDAPPAFWLPAPVRPAPVPAPDFMRRAAPDGMAGRASEVTFQFADLAGHPEAPPVALYPPVPLGAVVFAKADFLVHVSAWIENPF